MAKRYIDPVEYHNEMVACKKNGELSNKILKMFQLHAKEYSKNFYFDDESNRDDAVAFAMKDFLQYWKNFKYCNMMQFKLIRNFEIGDSFIIQIIGKPEITIKAGEKNDYDNGIFGIDHTINKSIENLKNYVKMFDFLHTTIHKVSMKIAFADITKQEDLSIRSYLEICLNEGKQLFKEDRNFIKNPSNTNRYYFHNAPDAFRFNTTICRNGIIKSINQITPKALRNGNKVLLGKINANANGFYNL